MTNTFCNRQGISKKMFWLILTFCVGGVLAQLDSLQIAIPTQALGFLYAKEDGLRTMAILGNDGHLPFYWDLYRRESVAQPEWMTIPKRENGSMVHWRAYKVPGGIRIHWNAANNPARQNRVMALVALTGKELQRWSVWFENGVGFLPSASAYPSGALVVDVFTKQCISIQQH
jgi:hypothetical protein